MSLTSKLAAPTLAALAAAVSLMAGEALANTKGPGPHSGGMGGPSRPPVPGQRAPGGPTQKPQQGGTYHPGKLVHHGGFGGRGHWGQDEYCYWLPTIGGGTVTGLRPVCYWVKN